MMSRNDYKLPAITGHDLDQVARNYAALKSCFFTFASASLPMSKLYELFGEVAKVNYDNANFKSAIGDNLTATRLIKLFKILILADKNKDPKTFKVFEPLKQKFGLLWEVLIANQSHVDEVINGIERPQLKK